MIERGVSSPISRHSLVTRALYLYVGNWRRQALIYGVTFLTVLVVALVADIRFGINLAYVVVLGVALVVTLLIVLPLSYVAISRSPHLGVKVLIRMKSPNDEHDMSPSKAEKAG